ncbi:MAG: glycosyltransferase family 4 protein [Desulfobacterales bacterium]
MNISNKSLSHQLLEGFAHKPLIQKRSVADEPLRVLHILSQQSGKTGSGVYLQAMVRHGTFAGIVQQVITGLPFGEPLPEIEPLSPENIHPVFFQTPALPFPIAGMSDVMPYESTRFSSFTPEMLEMYLVAFCRVISSTVKRFQPHVIHTHHLWLVTALTRILNPEIPIVTSCHGTELRQLVLAEHLKPFVIPGCSRIDRVLALHPCQIRQLDSEYHLGTEQIELAGAGYRDDIFHCDDSADDKNRASRLLKIVYAGKISRAKGVPWLIEAIKDIAVPESHSVRLFLAGSSGGPEGADILSRIDKADNRIKYVGPLSQEKLADLLKTADLFVLPSFYEGLPLVLLEALACGCRVVVTDLPGLSGWLPDEIVKNGFVQKTPLPRLTRVDEPDPQDLRPFQKNLADAISRQLYHAACPDNCALKQVKSCIGNYTWKSIFNKIERVYKKIKNKTRVYENPSLRPSCQPVQK